MMKGKSLSDWNPGEGKGKSSNDKLMSTEARDAKDTMNGTNELKAWRGKSGKPSGPYGVKATEF